ncbi:MAG TPA: bacillithiol biosynthesis BshC, partial [Thermoanaerobaculia bacterium]|nr:bacillithiol biosynthesis BshC [Thermoanaerobaculia bacterium]
LVAGQQVGIGGGPLYTLAKIASLLRLKRDLESRGVPATAMFWMATEDHDFAEVSEIRLHAPEPVSPIRAHQAHQERRIVGPMILPDELAARLRAALGLSTAEWLEPGISFRDSFARLIRKVAGSGSLVLIDALLPELRRAGKDLLLEMARNLDQVESAIDARGRLLADQGYRPQVGRSEDGHYSLLFRIDEQGIRHPLRAPHAAELVASDPAVISTGALARPLLQDFVFGSDVFVGGPAEVTYAAQLGEVYAAMNVNQPHIALRGHILIAPDKVLHAAVKYQLDASELLDPVEQIILRRERDDVARVARRVEAMRAHLLEGVAEVRDLVTGADPTLGRSIDRTSRRILYHCDKLEQRSKRALARRDHERHRAIERLSGTLMPGGVPQDRIIGWIGWWSLYGPRLLETMIEEIRPDQPVLRIAGLK